MSRLRIYNTSLAFAGEIDDFEMLSIVRKYRGREVLDMTISADKTNVDQLLKHYILTYGDYKVYEIEHSELSLVPNIPIKKIKAYGFGKTLAKRITVPPVGSAYDRITSQSPEYIVKDWIDNNMVSAVDTDRNIPYMAIATNQDRGTVVTDQTRYKKLDLEVSRVLAVDDLGYRFNKVGSTIEFDVYEGIDRSVGNGVNSEAIFSVKYDNILDEKYIDSAVTNQNQIYAGGTGEGVARVIEEVGSDASYERYEGFLDARDVTDTAELASRGAAAQVTDVQTLTIKFDPNANLVNGIDRDWETLVAFI